MPHCWEAANILRGPVDAADFKTYIFPLLFFKRISDVYDEELRDALEVSGGDEDYAHFPENHRFQIPDGCHWENVRARTTDVGQVLQYALREIERANPRQLYGIFGDANWKFADVTNKKAGEFYTPRSVVALMINILDPHERETIYDPACGTGGMLLEALAHVKQCGGNVNSLRGRLFGQEKNLTTAAVARINLFLHGVEDFKIVRGDTLREPTFFEGDRLATFDCVIANPPFSLDKWGEDLWPSDPFGRNFAGVPPQKSGDFAWVQHMIRSMAARTGRMAVVLPHGVLFRGGAEGRIRKHLLGMDLLEGVIGLAPNLFYGTGLAASILVLRQRKAQDRKGRVLVIDASSQFRRGRSQNTLESEHATQILSWYKNFANVSGAARVATMEEIEANDWNLNISRYVEPVAGDDLPTVDEALAHLKSALDEAYAAEDRLAKLMREAGLLA